jgi:hypothetical protein
MDQLISQTYNQLTGKTLNEAIFAFNQLNIVDARTGDLYFETYGVPNTINISNVPYERFVCYEYLMHLLKNENANKFTTIHKGTPYYFLAWTAFEIRNYAKAVFYMDLALGEDIRKSATTSDALNNPGGNLWKLIPAGPATRVIQQLQDATQQVLQKFQNRTNETITMDEFVNNFVLDSITQDVKNRSLISSLYSYFVEVDDLIDTIKIRSQNLSSIEPFLSNLLKGGLIFETLLKSAADRRNWIITDGRSTGNPPTTLGNFGHCSDFLTLFSISPNDFSTSAPDLSSIVASATDDQIGTSFSVTSKLRNTAGHDLRRDDIFQNPDDFKLLTEKQVNAICFVIKKAFL